jgi:phage FluMu protein Com
MIGRDLRCRNLPCDKLLATNFVGEQVSIMCRNCKRINMFVSERALTQVR